MSLYPHLGHLRQRYRADTYPSLKWRLALLKQLKQLLKDNEPQIIQAISADFGYRSPSETELAEIYPCLKAISHTQRHLSSWMQPEKRRVSVWFKPAKARVMYQPLGVVGIIVPWNYPLFLALGPMIGALAAGNRVMLKLSEFTPQFSLLFARLCEQYLGEKSLGDDWVKVIYGGPEVGAEFSALPFDHLLFTGSGTIGRKVMKAASEHLTPVTLELGGKSPVIIDKNYPTKRAAERVLFGKLLNAGQTCLAPDYVFVHQSQVEAFVEQVQRLAKKFYPDWKNKDYTALASEKQRERYQELLGDAERQGATLVSLMDDETFHNRKAPPLLVLNTTPEMRIRQEEIFGPLLPVVVYQEHKEALDWISSQPRPLALYLFSDKQVIIDQYMLKTVSGGVTLNDTVLHVSQEDLPFGGVGASGMGYYHGVEGFKTFSHSKSIFKQSRWSGTRLMYPPMGRLAKKLLALMKR